MALQLSQIDGINGFRINAATSGERFGGSVSGAGDVNGDGIDDLIIGEAYGGKFDAGRSYVVFGSATGFDPGLDVATLDGLTGFRLIGDNRNDNSGFSVASAGDVNGDGIDDLLIGAIRADPGGREDAGASYLVFGATAGFEATVDLGALDGANGFRLDGGAAYDNSGRAVASAGDVNGDGIDDLIVGAAYADPDGEADAGSSYIVFGSATGFDATVDLSALDGGNGFRLDGEAANDHSGFSVASAGDVNGDGIDDLIVGAVYADPDGKAQAGSSFVVFGSAEAFEATLDLSALDGSNGFRLDGVHTGDRSGVSVASAGDVNGDGVDDLIVGSPGTDEAYIVLGTSTGFAASVDLAELDGRNGFRIIDGSRRFGDVGLSVASAGDINGDGLDDLVVGSPGRYSYYEETPGATFVVFGSAEGFGVTLDVAALDGSDGFRIDPVSPYDGLGAVSGAGDVNGDGFDDLMIGVPGTNSAYVVFGTEELGGPNDAPIAADDVLTGLRPGDVVNLGADNGGGVDRDPDFDALTITSIGGTSVTPGESVTLASGLRVELLGGTEVRFDSVEVPLGTHISESITYEVSDQRGGNDSAVVSLEFSQNAIDLATLDGINGFRINAATSGERFGGSVSGAGDVNGDGIDDLIIGEAYGGKFDAGRSYVVFGSATGFDPGLDVATLDGLTGFRLIGDNRNDNSGFSVASAGDVNGDGIDDLLIGAIRADPGGREDAGASYLVFGATAGFEATVDLGALDGANGFRLDGGAAYDNSGRAVASAGDVNGDGIDDLIVGAAYADPDGEADAGSSYIVFGSATGFDATVDLSALDGGNGFRLDGEAANDHSGFSVASAGDVNGDGIDDLLIGAIRADPGGREDAGASYVVFGTTAEFDATVDLGALDGANGFRLDGGAAYDNSGRAVASAGDVNGDGIDDLIVGAAYADPDGEAHAGSSYIVFGSATGFDATVDLSALDGGNGFRLDGEAANDHSGFSVASAGDVNGDGIDDLIVGAQGAAESFVVLGSAAGFPASVNLSELDGTDGYRLLGASPYDGTGHTVAGAGDVNGDGVDDMIIGAPYAESGGKSYVVFGFSTPGSGSSAMAANPEDGFIFRFANDPAGGPDILALAAEAAVAPFPPEAPGGAGDTGPADDFVFLDTGAMSAVTYHDLLM